MPDCKLLVAIDTNAGDPNYLDFYISAQTQSWAAVGFSQTRSMVGTSKQRLCTIRRRWSPLFLMTTNLMYTVNFLS